MRRPSCIAHSNRAGGAQLQWSPEPRALLAGYMYIGHKIIPKQARREDLEFGGLALK